MLGRVLGRMSLAAVAILIGVWAISLFAQAPVTRTKQVMRHKLEESEVLLGALVTSNWVALDRHGRALKALTADPGWDRLRMPEFQKYTSAFERAVNEVIEAAGRRDQREALTAYNGLVASCVECHRYVARSRIAKAR